jgi:hypothetical protein
MTGGRYSKQAKHGADRRRRVPDDGGQAKAEQRDQGQEEYRADVGAKQGPVGRDGRQLIRGPRPAVRGLEHHLRTLSGPGDLAAQLRRAVGDPGVSLAPDILS